MVLGERFAWAHFPKTGGSTTHAMFELFPELVQHADPLGTKTEAHARFPEREEEIRGKILAMNIRRLPSYVLSWSLRVTVPRRVVGHPGDPGRVMRSPHEMSLSGYPDRRLSAFTGDGRFEVQRWIRTEHLADDFLEFISEFTDVDDARRERVKETRLNELAYDRELAHWFTPDQIEMLYSLNPLWSAVEEQAYGSTLLAADASG